MFLRIPVIFKNIFETNIQNLPVIGILFWMVLKLTVQRARNDTRTEIATEYVEVCIKISMDVSLNIPVTLF